MVPPKWALGLLPVATQRSPLSMEVVDYLISIKADMEPAVGRGLEGWQPRHGVDMVCPDACELCNQLVNNAVTLPVLQSEVSDKYISSFVE